MYYLFINSMHIVYILNIMREGTATLKAVC